VRDPFKRETLCPDRVTHVFIPGKNWRLSLAEITTFFSARKAHFKVVDLSKSFFVVASDVSSDLTDVNSFGGTIKIGRIISQIPSKIVRDAFLGREKEAQKEIRQRLLSTGVFSQLFENPPQKIVFGVSVYFESPFFLRFSKKIQRFIGTSIKNELASSGTRARFMGFYKSRRAPQLTHVEVLRKGLIEKSTEILLCIGRKQTFVAKTTSVHNPFEFQRRDIARPVQRKIYSIPPRLARIMVNLSNCMPEKTFLDPFCGVGTILQEALLSGARVIGMDIDPWCIKASRINLDWLKNEYAPKEAEYSVFLGDSRKLTANIGRETVDCIATEPDLGPPLLHRPTESYAKRITNKLEPLYCDFLNGAYEVLRPEGQLIFVTPWIRTRSGGFVTPDFHGRAEALGFRTVPLFKKEIFGDDVMHTEMGIEQPLVDVRMRHKISRRFNLLQK
jgi:tRNA G10  N-methylase Trm11